VGTVYHGLPAAVCPFNPAPRGGYLAFLGRISPEKGIERAIEIARRTGMRLRIAAKIDRVDEAYWHSRVKPLVSGPLIEFVGEVSEEDKPSFLGNASALLFPIDWPEPFGLVMIEAMSCGTPVIAWPRGSVPEIVEPGVTGFITSSVDEAVVAVGAAVRLDRARVRQRFEERFSATRMALDYLALYRKVGVKKTELVP
jgi:glycosyltransferase involved in cell wall biosynthesis